MTFYGVNGMAFLRSQSVDEERIWSGGWLESTSTSIQFFETGTILIGSRKSIWSEKPAPGARFTKKKTLGKNPHFVLRFFFCKSGPSFDPKMSVLYFRPGGARRVSGTVRTWQEGCSCRHRHSVERSGLSQHSARDQLRHAGWHWELR